MEASLPSVTSLQCVNALLGLGFEIADFDDRVVTLVERDAGRRVFVRRHAVLTPNELRAILIVAAVPDEVFLGEVARRGSGEARIERPGETSGVRDRGPIFDEVDEELKRRS